MPTPEFKVDTTCFDPYKNFRFRVKWDNMYVAGVSKVSGLTRTTQIIDHRSGGDPSTARMPPGQTRYELITLERGVTHDSNFDIWANKIWDHGDVAKGEDGSNQIVSLKDFRKDITIDMYNDAGQKVLAYNVYRCWVIEYHALPEPDANNNVITIQSIKLGIEGWERDTTITMPTEQSFTLPRANP